MPQRTAGRTRCGDLNHPRQSRHFWGIPFMCRGFSNSGGPPAKAAKMRASRLRSLCSLIRLASCWAWPLDPDKHISQYGHNRTDFSVARYSLLPRPQMGTFGLELKPDFSDLMVSGLFHGIRRKGNCRLPPSSLLCWAPRDGSLWIGTDAALAHWANQHLITYLKGEGLVSSILQDVQGKIRTTCIRPGDNTQPFCQITDTGVRCYGNEYGVPAFVAAES
jgi:hypothetical protein